MTSPAGVGGQPIQVQVRFGRAPALLFTTPVIVSDWTIEARVLIKRTSTATTQYKTLVAGFEKAGDCHGSAAGDFAHVSILGQHRCVAVNMYHGRQLLMRVNASQPADTYARQLCTGVATKLKHKKT